MSLDVKGIVPKGGFKPEKKPPPTKAVIGIATPNSGSAVAASVATSTLTSSAASQTTSTAKSSFGLTIPTTGSAAQITKNVSSVTMRASNAVVVSDSAEALKRALKLQQKRAKTQEFWNLFALLNNTIFIKGSFYDGGSSGGGATVEDCLENYHRLVKSVKENKLRFSLKDPSVIEAMETQLGHMIAIWKMRATERVPLKGEKPANKEITEAAKSWFKHINTRLQKEKFAYFPVGYAGMVKANGEPISGGHAVGCLVEDLGRQIQITYFNLGEGVQFHPECGFTTTHTQPSYAFYPCRMLKSKWEQHGEKFLSYLMRMKAEMQIKYDDIYKDNALYESSDLYDLLVIFGDISPSVLAKKAARFKRKSQHVGDCPDKCCRNMMTNFLSEKRGLDEEEVQKFLLNIHFASLMEGVKKLEKALKEDPENPKNPEYHRLLLNAVSVATCYLRYLRKEGFIEEGEYEEAADYLLSIPEMTFDFTPIPPESTPLFHLKSFELEKESAVQPVSIEKIYSRGVILLKIPSFNPHTFATDLKTWLEALEQFKGWENAWSFAYSRYLFIQSLPVPKWNDPLDPWSKINPKDIPEVLASLEKLFTINCEGSSMLNNLVFLMRSHIYVIVEKLSRVICKELQGFACFFPIIDQAYFKSTFELEIYRQIVHYFKAATESAKGKTLFPPLEPKRKHHLDFGHFHEFLAQFNNYSSFNGNPWGFFGTLSPELKILNTFVQAIYTYEDYVEEFISDGLYDIRKYLEDESSNALYFTEERDAAQAHRVVKVVKHKALQIGVAVQWLHTQLKELNKPEIHRALNICFFSPDALKEAISARSETVEEIRSLILTGLNAFGENFENWKGIAFLFSLGLHLEEHFSHILKKPLNEKVLLNYEQRAVALLSKIGDSPKNKNESYLCDTLRPFFAACELRREKGSIERWIATLTAAFTGLGAQNGHEEGVFYYEDMGLFRLHLFQKFNHFLSTCSQKNAVLNRVCDAIVEGVFGKELVHIPRAGGSWVLNEDGIATSKRCSLNFYSWMIVHPEYNNRLYLLSEKERAHLQKHNIEPPKWVWTSSSLRYFIDLTETTYLRVEESMKPVVYKRKSPQEQFGHEQIEGALAYNSALLFFRYFHVISRNSDQTELNVSLGRSSHELYAKIEIRGKQIKISRVDTKDKSRTGTLANLKGLSTLHPHYDKTLKFDSWDNILCFVNEETDEIEELLFPNLKLGFARKPEGLESMQYPGYFWQEDLKPRDLKNLGTEVIVLKNSENKIKVILINPRKEKRDLSLSTKTKEIYLGDAVHYCAFDLNHIDDPLRGKDFLQGLYLVYFYKVHSEFARATEALSQLKPPFEFDPHIFAVLHMFLRVKNYSAPSLAFNMKILLFVAEKYHLIRKEDLNLGWSFLAHSQEWHLNYLRALGNENAGGIAKKDRLDLHDEGFILSTMVREKITLWKILEIREELLNTKERRATSQYVVKTIETAPNVYSTVHMPGYFAQFTPHCPHTQKEPDIVSPVRVSREYLEEHFCAFYNLAKNAEPFGFDPFDLTLPALLKTKKTSLGEILFYVRHFSDVFQDISFEAQMDEKAFKKTFESIVKAVSSLRSHPNFPFFYWHTLKQSSSFDYTPKISVSLGPPLVYPPLVDATPLAIDNAPFALILPMLFDVTKKERRISEPLFSAKDFPNATRQERDLLIKFEAGQKALAERPREVFKLKKGGENQALGVMQKERDKSRDEIQKLENDIDTRLNHPFKGKQNEKAVRELNLLFLSEETHPITPEMVMERVILRGNDPTLLREERPMLSEDEGRKIIHDTIHLYHLKVVLAMWEDAITLTKRLALGDVRDENALVEILNHQFTFDPKKYPEITYYSAKVGIRPRSAQVETLEWIFQGVAREENRNLSAAGGAGKTSVYALLAMMRARRNGFMPIFVTTEAMFSADQATLSALLNLVGIELESLDIRMDFDFTLEELKRIHQKIKNCVRKKSALIITPVLYYALKVNYLDAAIVEDLQPPINLAFSDAFRSAEKDPIQLAVEQAFIPVLEASVGAAGENLEVIELPPEQEERRAVLLKILNLFKNNAMLVIDESHRNDDPSTQAIMGSGDFISVDEKESLLLFELMKPLVGIKPQVASKAKFQWGKPTPDALTRMREVFAIEISNFLFKSQHEGAPYLRYLMDPLAPKPVFPSSISEGRRHLITLTRYFLIVLLPKVLVMTPDFDSVLSKKYGWVQTPAYNGTPSFAQFKDAFLATVQTIKAAFHQGLELEQIETLYANLRRSMDCEKHLYDHLEQTPSFLLFKKWTKDKFKLGRVWGKEEWTALHLLLSKDPEVIAYHLQDEVLRYNGASREQIPATPAHMANSGRCSLHLTATPMPPMAYPGPTHDFRGDSAFEAEVVSVLKESANQRKMEIATIDDFFHQLKARKSDLRNVRALIDASGVICDINTYNLAVKWLESSDLDGVFYFSVGEGRFSLLLRQGMRVITLPNGTAKIKEDLAAAKVKMEELNLGTLFDAARAESVNNPLPPGSVGVVFVGENITLSHLIQSVIRLRGFLTENMKQSVIFALLTGFAKKLLPPNQLYHASLLLNLALRNEANKNQGSLELAAFQAVAVCIEEFSYFSKDSKDPKRPANGLNPRYARGVRARVNPYEGLDAVIQTDPTEKGLWAFAKQYYAKFGYPVSFEANQLLQQQLSTIIKSFATTIETISSVESHKGEREIRQRCIIKTKQKQKMVPRNNISGVIPAKRIKPPDITSPNYTLTLTEKNKVRTRFNEPYIIDHFYIDDDQMEIGYKSGVSMSGQILKPINFLLITLQKDRFYAVALSDDTAAEYVNVLRSVQKNPNISHKSFMIRADANDADGSGILYQNGNGVLAASESEIGHAVRSPWIKEVLMFVSILNGKMLQSKAFKELISTQKWPRFEEFFQKILQAHNTEGNYSFKALESYISVAGKTLNNLLLNS